MDTSALVKLVLDEGQSDELRDWLSNQTAVVTSDLSRTELLRAVRRQQPSLAVGAREVLDSLILLSLGSEIFDQAGRLNPAELRSLDALHLASALDLGDDLDGLVTYDHRLADAARSLGVQVYAPGASG